MATEAEKRLHRCCFTGHRPEKMGWSEAQVREVLEKSIRKAIADDFSVFITGMARGVDIWAAEIVLGLKQEYKDLRLICAIPFQGFETQWGTDWQNRYITVLRAADYVQTVSERYSQDCFQTRNEWMVDHAARVIAVWNGKPSGTKNTIEYAMKSQTDITFCHPVT